MTVTRRVVLEELAAASDAAREDTTTIRHLASRLNVDDSVIEGHLGALASCELARMEGAETVRVTITGEELLELDTDEGVIVDTQSGNPGG